MNRGRGTCKIVDLINFQKDRLRHIVSQQLETRVVEEMHDVLTPACEEVIETKNLVTFA
jgi:hypothetical protein